MNAAFAKPDELTKQYRAYLAALRREPHAGDARFTEPQRAALAAIFARHRRTPDEVN